MQAALPRSYCSTASDLLPKWKPLQSRKRQWVKSMSSHAVTVRTLKRHRIWPWGPLMLKGGPEADPCCWERLSTGSSLPVPTLLANPCAELRP